MAVNTTPDISGLTINECEDRPVATTRQPKIIVQGGAFCPHGEINRRKEFLDGVKASARAGYEILSNGGTAVDAVEAAVRELEDNGNFNAGYGSYLNNNGEVECDALIMDGDKLDTGAVMNGRYFRNPVSLAKKIMQDSHHCALSGDGALEFALRHELRLCDPPELISERARAKTYKYKEFPNTVRTIYPGGPIEEKGDVFLSEITRLNEQLSEEREKRREAERKLQSLTDKHSGGPLEEEGDEYDTVSAVAMDAEGHLACATSSGGIPGKLKGRVGDAALVGCGGYANERGAATVTGHGESIMKMTLAREIVSMMENGTSAQISAENALANLRDQCGDRGAGGVIAIDEHGNLGKAFTTAVMPWASIVGTQIEFGMEVNERITSPI